MNHTPGPWVVIETKYRTLICAAQGDHVTACEKPTPADARLIAAAPDLLAALQWWIDQMHDDACDDMGKLLDAMTERARAAINKATGE